MAIGTNDNIDKFGTQDVVDDTSTSLITNTSFSVAADIATWTNDDDAPLANFVLECQFDTTAPTDDVGSIDLYARVLNIQSTNDPGEPSATNKNYYLGHFPIDWTIANDVNYFSYIYGARLPNTQTSQQYDFYIHNNATGQQIGVDWNMWITPLTEGPSA